MSKQKDKKEKGVEVELENFTMTTQDGKKFEVSAPVESLDKEAKQSLSGVYRTA